MKQADQEGKSHATRTSVVTRAVHDQGRLPSLPFSRNEERSIHMKRQAGTNRGILPEMRRKRIHEGMKTTGQREGEQNQLKRARCRNIVMSISRSSETSASPVSQSAASRL